MRLVTYFLFLFFFGVSSQADNLKQGTCIKDGYECSQCDEDYIKNLEKLLKSADDPTADPRINSIEDLLEALPIEMKKNMIVVGGSMSVQESAPGNLYDEKQPPLPRILFKTPNAEAFLGITMDPSAKKFKAAELMIWNGKKGGHSFPELDMSQPIGKRYNPDAGKECAKCHTERLRPNWDTYRAWAGVLPPKDDELKPNDPSTQVYLNFLRKIATEKKTNPGSRWAKLPFPNIVTSSKSSSRDLTQENVPEENAERVLDPSEQIRLIEERLANDQSVAIPHFPLTFGDGVTVNTFDQLSELNACQVSRELRNHPRFPSFKYALAAVFLCEEDPQPFPPKPAGGLTTEKPPILKLMSASKATEFSNYFGETNASKAYDKLSSTVEKSYALLNTEKSERHKKLLQQMGATQTDLDKIQDLNGVEEKFIKEISSLRFLLEPLGIEVGEWSMSFGSDLSRPHYNFADRFPVSKQKAVAEVTDEFIGLFPNKLAQLGISSPGSAAEEFKQDKDFCEWVTKKSIRAMEAAKPVTRAGPAQLIVECKEQMARGKDAFIDVGRAAFKDRCLQCHKSTAVVPQSLLFSESSDLLRKHLSQHAPAAILDKIKSSVSGTSQKKMPPMGPALTSTEKTAIIFYLEGMLSEKPERTQRCEDIFKSPPSPSLKKGPTEQKRGQGL